MEHIRYYLTVILCGLASCLVSAVDVVSIQPASDQEFHPLPGELRVVGRRISMLITFNQAPVTTDKTKIAVTLRGVATDARTGTDTFEQIAGNPLAWKYSFTPLDDGQVDLKISAGLGTNAGGSSPLFATYPMTVDWIPVLTISDTPNGATILFTTTVDGFEPGESPVSIYSEAIKVDNGRLSGNTIVGVSSFLDVTPFGYGTVTLELNPGFVVDKWGNQNPLTTKSRQFIPPVGTIGQAPRIVSVIGTSPDNRVYRTGDVIDFNIVFDRSILLTYVAPLVLPTIKMNCTGNGPPADAQIINIIGSTLYCRLVVQAGHRSNALDVASATALVTASESALIGSATSPDFIADYTLPVAGARGSLSSTAAYSINVEAAKPLPQDITGTSSGGACGAGSGIALLLAVSLLGMSWCRRRSV